MKNSQQHLGNEANLATFSLSHDVIFLMVSPLLGRFLLAPLTGRPLEGRGGVTKDY